MNIINNTYPKHIRRGLTRIAILLYCLWAVGATFVIATGPYSELRKECYPYNPKVGSGLSGTFTSDANYGDVWGQDAARSLSDRGCVIN